MRFVTSFPVRAATLARTLGGKLHPDRRRCGGRIAATRFAQNGGFHTR
ncbi:hypothetical protein JQ582_39985 [Bradyrhizobium japonicum]|nr:hypothetical protein [Bradyrhizobium japonicum]MBR0750109.1 hypothetical protein [Bradyrhizobium japonicum]MCD9109265.1 hypothetical protein [Bradyrhizobium japonicum]MCD9259708.1 hypothetical protein [Bradyrhizobium japonicum SEMIA 5079]MCD9823304.1 hypothetical protein [Bradyrhizobium japonicum]MCD9895870.1 hypothetical protein [Bradyrhizobium japonicum]